MKDGRNEKRGKNESKQLTRGEVLALLRVCWLRLIENGGKKSIEEIEDFLTLSMRLAEAFYGVNEVKDFQHVNAIGFKIDEDEEEEDEDEEEERAEK